MAALQSEDNVKFDETAACAPAYLFASLLASYPDEGFVQGVTMLAADRAVADVFESIAGDAWKKAKARIDQIAVDHESVLDLRSEFIDLFDRGRERNSLYESEFGIMPSLAKPRTLAEVVNFYLAFGFDLGERLDLADHVAIELEFRALMGMKLAALIKDGDADGANVVQRGCELFLKEHLGRFPSAIAGRPAVAQSEFYGAAFTLIAALNAHECAALGVTPDYLDWLSSGADAEGHCCGSNLAGNPAASGGHG